VPSTPGRADDGTSFWEGAALIPPDRPHVIAHVAVALNGATRGFVPDLGEFYGLAATWREDVTLTGADTILAQEPALAAAPPGPGPDPDGPLLAVVDSRSRVTAWDALRGSGHWRDVIALRGRTPGARVDLADALGRMAIDGARTVRVDSGGGLIGALLERGLIDEMSLLVHPRLGDGLSWDDGRRITATFTLTHEERRDGGLVWLRYAVHSR
jgi:2,5-diamino-6-(ribosylamino)-4(3H)-pyrimidinone 5'-phosphate reductase